MHANIYLGIYISLYGDSMSVIRYVHWKFCNASLLVTANTLVRLLYVILLCLCGVLNTVLGAIVYVLKGANNVSVSAIALQMGPTNFEEISRDHFTLLATDNIEQYTMIGKSSSLWIDLHLSSTSPFTGRRLHYRIGMRLAQWIVVHCTRTFGNIACIATCYVWNIVRRASSALTSPLPPPSCLHGTQFFSSNRGAKVSGSCGALCVVLRNLIQKHCK